MDEPTRCDKCGAPLRHEADNVIPLRTPQAAGPPQMDLLELGDGQVRLRINLVVPREAAIRVLSLLGAADD
jgi:hypothetical protein